MNNLEKKQHCYLGIFEQDFIKIRERFKAGDDAMYIDIIDMCEKAPYFGNSKDDIDYAMNSITMRHAYDLLSGKDKLPDHYFVLKFEILKDGWVNIDTYGRYLMPKKHAKKYALDEICFHLPPSLN